MMEMTREMAIGKIHRAVVTGADLHYVGSITVDEDLLDAANIVPGQKVDIVDVNNGERLSTYTIAGERGSGTIQLNGAAAHKVTVGDLVIIMAYAQVPESLVRQVKRGLRPRGLRACPRAGAEELRRLIDTPAGASTHSSGRSLVVVSFRAPLLVW